MQKIQSVQSLQSLDDFRALLKALPGPDNVARSGAVAHESILTKPAGALGRLEDMTAWLCAWQGRYPPRLENPKAVVFAGNHGVATQGVSAYPAEVTTQMVANFRTGGAAINQLCRIFGATLQVQALDLDHPTANFLQAPAMDVPECVAALSTGMAAVPAGSDVLCVGEIGIGNTTAAATICHGLFGGTADTWTGPGTGMFGEQLTAKARVVARAVALHRHSWRDALDVLRYVGGRELAAIAGAVVAARLQRVPVLLDGYVCTAAAAVLESYATGALDHCMIAHVSAENAHRHLCSKLGKTPLLDLDMRLGEASGTILALALLQGAIACHTGMATFSEARVSGPCREHSQS